MRLVGADVARYLHFVASSEHPDAPTQFVLVTSGSLTPAAIEALYGSGIQVWDSQKLAELAPSDLIEEYFGMKSEKVKADSDESRKAHTLRAALTALAPGKGEWPAYQRLIADILEFLFCPPLGQPHYELPDEEAGNKRDVIFENPLGAGFWAQVRSDYVAHYIVVDAKNYEDPIRKRSVLDISHYLKPYGCGLFALLVSRKGPDDAAAHATREQWIGGQKMIVHLDDTRIVEMLDLKAVGGEPQEVIRRQIANFRMAL
jgi:hypothetical protein